MSSHEPMIPELPSPKELFLKWQVCHEHPYWRHCRECVTAPRTYRILVDWLRQGRFKNDRIEELPKGFQKLFAQIRQRPHHRENTPKGASSPSEKFPDLKSLPANLVASLRPSETKESFYEWLLLAWCIQQVDHARAQAISAFQATIQQLTNQGLKEKTLLDLTSVPSEILVSLPNLRQYLDGVRGELSTPIRSYRQKMFEGRPTQLQDSEGEEEEIPPSFKWEQHLAGKMGMGKLTIKTSRQVIWTWVFNPLVKELLPKAKRKKKDRWKVQVGDEGEKEKPFLPDDVFKKASRLIHLRYPNLWDDKWQRVRDRCGPNLNF